MTRCAQAADVGIIVATTLHQRDDVVGHRCWSDPSLGAAVPAERLHLKPALSLLYSSAPTQSFDHERNLKRKAPEARRLRTQLQFHYFGTLARRSTFVKGFYGFISAI
jgi:hypothetical protein